MSDTDRILVMNTTSIFNIPNIEKYLEIGRLAEIKIHSFIAFNSIIIKETHEATMTQTATYMRPDNNDGQHYILIPKESDLTAMQRTIILAHEYGHFILYRESNDFQRTLLESKNEYLLLRHEKLAWAKAHSLLIHMGIPEKDFISDFTYLKEMGLLNYKPRTLIHVGSTICRLWVMSYLLMGILFTFSNNDVPIPMLFDFEGYSFWRMTHTLFGITLMYYLIMYIIRRHGNIRLN